MKQKYDRLSMYYESGTGGRSACAPDRRHVCTLQITAFLR